MKSESFSGRIAPRVVVGVGVVALTLAVFLLVPSGHRRAPETREPARFAAAQNEPHSRDRVVPPAPAPRDSAPAALAREPLFLAAADQTLPAHAPIPPARRVRVVEVNPWWLDGKRSPFFDPRRYGEVVPLALWSDTQLPWRVLGSEVLGQRRQLVRGAIDGAPGSSVLLTIADDAVAFSVDLGAGQQYGGASLDDGRLAIYEVDPAAPGTCGGGVPSLLDGDALAAIAARSVSARRGGAPSSEVEIPPTAAAAPTTTALIDVLVFYDSEVLADPNPTPGLISRVDLAISIANDAFVRSETRARLRRAGLRSTTYTEDGDLAHALDHLRATSDGSMDEVHGIRDALGADLVCLLVQRSNSSTVGIAYLLDEPGQPSNDLFGFSVVQSNFLESGYTFVHEIGHNLGCAHDRENSQTGGAFPYSYGYRFNGNPNNRQYRTIMAYSPGTSVGYFSNPRITPASLGVPVGVAAGLPGEADNAQTVTQLAFEVASYRLNTDPPERGELIAVSTRAFVGPGDQALIGGLIIGSPGPKHVLIRGLGPSLTAAGVSGALPNPAVRIHRGDGSVVTSNNDWAVGPSAAELVQIGRAPADTREAALTLDLPSGPYTAVLSGESGATGVGLIEVYEITRANPRLIALSTRGYVATGDQVMIGGLIVNGNAGETKRIILRALGPSLEAAGVSGALFDPAMRLHNGAGEELIQNDDWDFLPDNIQDEIRALNMAPGNRRESVLLIDLPPGPYTVIVRPFENDEGAQPGVGLVEAYEVTQ